MYNTDKLFQVILLMMETIRKAHYNDYLDLKIIQQNSIDNEIESIYEWIPSKDWVIGQAPFGGHITSVILKASLLHFNNKKNIDPASLDIHFFKPNLINVPIVIKINTLKKANMNVIEIKLFQNNRLNILATGITTNYEKESQNGITRITDSSEYISRTKYVPFNKKTKSITHINGFNVVRNMDVGFINADHNPDKIEIDQYIRLEPLENWDIISLSMLADPIYPFLQYVNNAKTAYWFPTITLSIQFFKYPNPNTRWVRQIGRSRFMINSRAEIDIEVYDEEGNILLISRQMCLQLSWAQNQRSTKL